MAVRPIDANAMLNELRPVNFEAEHSAVLLSDVSKMMREWVERQPTLTQPNEPLTLDELGEMSYTDWVWLEFPREKPSDNCWERGWKAYRLYSHERYGVSWIAYRRPPEGGNDVS